VCSSAQCPLQTSPLTQLPASTSTSQCHILPLYVTLRCQIPPPAHKICSFPLGIPIPSVIKNHLWVHPTHCPKWHNCCTSTELLLLYVCTINWSELVYSLFSHQTLQSLDTLVPNPNLYPNPNPVTLLTTLQPLASILHTSYAKGPK